MPRILEQEVMSDLASVEAYDSTSQKKNLSFFVIEKLEPDFTIKSIADLGCGNCNNYSSLLNKFPFAKITGVDASQKMLEKAKTNTITYNVELINSYIQNVEGNFDLVVSFLALHQLPDANIMWEAIKRLSTNNKFILFDLIRVEDDKLCDKIIKEMSPTNNLIFNVDFKNSLKAAFTEEEIKQQLLDNNIKAHIEIINLTPEFKTIFITGNTTV
jgi:SAM-dependent methyltransferase